VLTVVATLTGIAHRIMRSIWVLLFAALYLTGLEASTLSSQSRRRKSRRRRRGGASSEGEAGESLQAALAEIKALRKELDEFKEVFQVDATKRTVAIRGWDLLVNDGKDGKGKNGNIVVGNGHNLYSVTNSLVTGIAHNAVRVDGAAMIGGKSNMVQRGGKDSWHGTNGVIVGGDSNVVYGLATVVGGSQNKASRGCVIAGGWQNVCNQDAFPNITGHTPDSVTDSPGWNVIFGGSSNAIAHGRNVGLFGGRQQRMEGANGSEETLGETIWKTIYPYDSAMFGSEVSVISPDGGSAGRHAIMGGYDNKILSGQGNTIVGGKGQEIDRGSDSTLSGKARQGEVELNEELQWQQQEIADAESYAVRQAQKAQEDAEKAGPLDA
jgi:hypothetical protein